MEDKNEKMKEVSLPKAKLIVVTLLLSMVGVFDTAYLTIKRYSHSDIGCSIFEGCDLVTTSSYSAILGVPVAVLGIIFYITVFVLSLLYLRLKERRFIILLFGLSSVGLLMSAWFVYTQAFVLNAYCFYCFLLFF